MIFQGKKYFIKKLFFILTFLLFLSSFVYAQNFEIFTAIYKGDLNYVKEFLANGGDVDTSAFGGITLLRDAISFKQTRTKSFAFNLEIIT